MKRKYQTPKCKAIDFCYDEQVTAESGHVSNYGDPDYTGYCQQSSPTSCVYFWVAGSDWCQSAPMSLRPRV